MKYIIDKQVFTGLLLASVLLLSTSSANAKKAKSYERAAIIASIAKSQNISATNAGIYVNAIIQAMKKNLTIKPSDTRAIVSITGFGSLSVVERNGIISQSGSRAALPTLKFTFRPSPTFFK